MTRAALAALALLCVSCNAEIEALRPGAAPAGAVVGVGASGGAGGDAGGSPAACETGDGSTCLGQAGDPCDEDHPCCTGSCEMSPDGDLRCAYLGGCHQRCETCHADFECCSGRCESERCAPSEASCLAEGELCTKEEDCCPAGPGTHCGQVAGELRCHTPSDEHLPEGDTCALPIDCESDVCVPADGKLACASGCRPEGASCSSSADCCDPDTHECLPASGGPICVVVP